LSESRSIPEAFSKLTSYDKWLQEESLPVLRGFYIADLKQVELAPWKRRGGLGTYVNLEGTGGTNDAYVAEIPPGGSLNPGKYLFEELIYVLSGRGATAIWNEGGPKQTFEWQAGSLFSPPLNTWRQHFNGQGDKPARILAVTTAPTIINLFHNLDFVLNNPFIFRDRYAGEQEYFSGAGKVHAARIWESNFVPDVPSFKLLDKSWRGAGGKGMMFEMSNNTMAAHISEFPVGTYKNGHRHGPGAHVIIIGGEGYSLLWQEGRPMTRVDWHAGSMFVPPQLWFHQHFNTGATPARYLALRWGGEKHRMGGVLGLRGSNEGNSREGGNKIEYKDEDPEIRRIFEAELAKRGVKSGMAPFFEKK